MIKIIIVPLSLIAVLVALSTTTTTSAKELHLAVASDLIYAFQKIGKSFEEENGIKTKWIFGSSGILSTQIQGGMEVDLFASANPGWVDRLEEKGLVLKGSRKVFALGRIALCTYQKSKLKVEGLEDLVKPRIGRVAIANPSHAPYGVAAKETLEKIGIWESVKSKMVYGENVLQAQTYVKKGEVDAGIIALSLANIPEIRCYPISAELHHPIQQTIIILNRTEKKALAKKFIDFLTQKEGKDILREYGFSLP